MTPPKAPRAGELLKQKNKHPSLAPVPPELLGKVAQQVSPFAGGTQGAWTPTTSLPAAAA